MITTYLKKKKIFLTSVGIDIAQKCKWYCHIFFISNSAIYCEFERKAAIFFESYKQ